MCGGSRRTGCFAMIWRVSLRFVFWLVPFFSEAGRKSNRDFSISKLLMKTFSFYSAAEADRLQMQWPHIIWSACCADGAYHYAGCCFYPSRSVLKERFFFDWGCKYSLFSQTCKWQANEIRKDFIKIWLILHYGCALGSIPNLNPPLV